MKTSFTHIIATLALGLIFIANAAMADDIKKERESLPASKLGDYRFLGGDASCETALSLQKLKMKINGKSYTAVELVATEMALDAYIWRRGLSTLFVNINGKEIIERNGNSSHRQGIATTYESSYEEGVLIGLEENKVTYALIPIQKKSVLTTLTFSNEKEQFTLNQLTEGDLEIQTNCLYEKIF